MLSASSHCGRAGKVIVLVTAASLVLRDNLFPLSTRLSTDKEVIIVNAFCVGRGSRLAS